MDDQGRGRRTRPMPPMRYNTGNLYIDIFTIMYNKDNLAFLLSLGSRRVTPDTSDERVRASGAVPHHYTVHGGGGYRGGRGGGRGGPRTNDRLILNNVF